MKTLQKVKYFMIIFAALAILACSKDDDFGNENISVAIVDDTNSTTGTDTSGTNNSGDSGTGTGTADSGSGTRHGHGLRCGTCRGSNCRRRAAG